MRLELEPTSTNLSLDKSGTVSNPVADNSYDGSEFSLQKGIKAAKEGNRTQAKQLLLRVIEVEPANETALMWLASISEYPEELLGYLNTVLLHYPNNEKAADWSKSTNVLLANDFLQRGIEATKQNRKDFARQNFRQSVAHKEESEEAWLWLSSVTDSVEEKNVYLRKVLNLNPENENALMMLKSAKNQNVEVHFLKAVREAVADNRSAAKETLKKVFSDAPAMEEAWVLKSFLVESFSEKVECLEKLLEINPENPLANVNWTVLMEITAKAEQVETQETLDKLAAQEAHRQQKLPKNQTQHSPQSSEPSISLEIPAIVSQEEMEAKVKEVNLPESFADEAVLVQEPTVEEEYFEKLTPETVPVVETAFNEPAENNVVEQSELSPEPQIDEYYQEYKEKIEAELLNYEAEEPAEFLQYQPEEVKESALVEVYEEQSEAVRTTGDFPKYAYDTDDDVISVFQPETDTGMYAESEEDIFSPVEAAAETEYVQSAAQSMPKYAEDEEADFSNGEYQGSVEVEEQKIAENVEDNFVSAPTEKAVCPYCKAKNGTHEFVCNSCHTILTLSDLELLLAHQDADKHTLQYALEELEAAGENYELDADELKMLGIGYINLKQLRLGLAYLQDSLKLNPNDVVLSSQINALAIRLADIEKQEDIHSSVPKNKKILVVDDSATVRKLISAKLSKSGHEVLCAVDGIEALEKINEGIPDLILLDINMPRMDGYQVCKLIRNNEETKDVPIVMISGKDGFFDKVRGRMAGTTGYITKPFGPETLMKTVETYIV